MTKIQPLDTTNSIIRSTTYRDRGIFIFPVQLTTSRIGSLTSRLIHTLLYVCDDVTMHTYILLTAALNSSQPLISLVLRSMPTMFYRDVSSEELQHFVKDTDSLVPGANSRFFRSRNNKPTRRQREDSNQVPCYNNIICPYNDY